MGWLDVFTRNEYKDLFLESVRFCQKEKGLEIHAWCIMTSHIHLVFRSIKGQKPELLIGDLKRFTSRAIVKAIEEIELSTKVEGIKLDLDKVSPEGKALLYKDISKLLTVKPELADLRPDKKQLPQESVVSSAAEMKKISKDAQTLELFN